MQHRDAAVCMLQASEKSTCRLYRQLPMSLNVLELIPITQLRHGNIKCMRSNEGKHLHVLLEYPGSLRSVRHIKTVPSHLSHLLRIPVALALPSVLSPQP